MRLGFLGLLVAACELLAACNIAPPSPSNTSVVFVCTPWVPLKMHKYDVRAVILVKDGEDYGVGWRMTYNGTDQSLAAFTLRERRGEDFVDVRIKRTTTWINGKRADFFPAIYPGDDVAFVAYPEKSVMPSFNPRNYMFYKPILEDPPSIPNFDCRDK